MRWKDSHALKIYVSYQSITSAPNIPFQYLLCGKQQNSFKYVSFQVSMRLSILSVDTEGEREEGDTEKGRGSPIIFSFLGSTSRLSRCEDS